MRTPLNRSVHRARSIQSHRQMKFIVTFAVIIGLALFFLLFILLVQAQNHIVARYDEQATDVTTRPDPSHEVDPSSTTSDDAIITRLTEPTVPKDPLHDAHAFIPATSKLQRATYQERDAARQRLFDKISLYLDEQQNARVGFFYLNLHTGEQVGYNDLEPFVVGALINIPIHLVLYEHYLDESLSPDDTITLTSSHYANRSNIFFSDDVGEAFSLRELAHWSMIYNDPVATAMILEKIGGIDNVCFRMRQISCIVDYRSAIEYSDYRNIQHRGRHRISTLDLSYYFREIYRHYLRHPEVFQPLINDLFYSKTHQGLTQDLDADLILRASGQNGTYSSYASIAMIFSEEPYILCIVAETGTAATASQIQRELASYVEEYFALCY